MPQLHPMTAVITAQIAVVVILVVVPAVAEVLLVVVVVVQGDLAVVEVVGA